MSLTEWLLTYVAVVVTVIAVMVTAGVYFGRQRVSWLARIFIGQDRIYGSVADVPKHAAKIAGHIEGAQANFDKTWRVIRNAAEEHERREKESG